jgi:hypothetical protein
MSKKISGYCGACKSFKLEDEFKYDRANTKKSPVTQGKKCDDCRFQELATTENEKNLFRSQINKKNNETIIGGVNLARWFFKM